LSCSTYVGWSYEKAFDAMNEYKEGKVLLEKALLVKECKK